MVPALFDKTYHILRKALEAPRRICTKLKARVTKTSLFFVVLLVVILGVIVIGYLLMGIAIFGSLERTTKYQPLGGVTTGTQVVAAYLPAKGNYLLNETTGGDYLTATSYMTVKNSHEELAFGMPISSFPSVFSVDAAGYYSVTLENVTPGVRLVLLRPIESTVYPMPRPFLFTYGSYVLWLGADALILFTLILFNMGDDIEKEAERFRGMVEIRGIFKIFFFSSPLMIYPFIAFIIITSMSSFGVSNVLLQILALSLSIGAPVIYWIKHKAIIGHVMSIFGYKASFTINKIWKIVVVLVAILEILMFVSFSSAIPFLVDWLPLIMWLMAPLSLIFSLLLPIIDPFNAEAEAKYCLSHFLSEYELDAKHADFGFLESASACVSSILRRHNVTVSQKTIEKQVISDLMRPTKNQDLDKKDNLVRRLIVALNPLNMAELNQVISQFPEEKADSLRVRSIGVLELLYYAIVIAVTLLAFVLHLLGLY